MLSTKIILWILFLTLPIAIFGLVVQKHYFDGSIDRFKAHLVAPRISQRHIIDYHETFSPILRMTSFHFLIAFATHFNLPQYHIDVKAAFLHGTLDEEIYMHQPPYFVFKAFPRYFCKLQKSIYGLKHFPCRCL